MSKAFTRDENEGPEIPDDVPPAAPLLAPGVKNYITPAGAVKLRDELQRLVEVTRPQLAESRDDPDAKRQLARLDQRIAQLEESLQSAEVVEPPASKDVVRFGACVRVRESDGAETSYRIVGVDEADADENWVSWLSPIARALLNRKRGELVRFKFPSGEATLQILEISYE